MSTPLSITFAEVSCTVIKRESSWLFMLYSMQNFAGFSMFFSRRCLLLQNQRWHPAIASWALNLECCHSRCHEVRQSPSQQQTSVVETLVRQLLSQFQHCLFIMNLACLNKLSLYLMQMTGHSKSRQPIAVSTAALMSVLYFIYFIFFSVIHPLSVSLSLCIVPMMS